MKQIITTTILFFVLLDTSFSQDVSSQKKLDTKDSDKIVKYLKMASSKHDSLIHYKSIISFAEDRCANLKQELLLIFNQAEIEMLKVLSRYGFNSDIYTIMTRMGNTGEIEFHIVKKSDIPERQQKQPSIREP
jgi:hypothetical protein